MRTTAQQLEADLAQMIKYLDLRRRMRDWHGVMDAAADIREIEAKLQLCRTGSEVGRRTSRRR